MDKTPKLHERLALAVGSGLTATPLCFLLWFGLNVQLLNSAELGLVWLFLSIGIFALLGFVFTYRVSKLFVNLWRFASSWL